MSYMNTFAVSSSDFQKKYKMVVERVKQTKQPALLTSKKEPQTVRISLEDYDKLEALRRRGSAQNLLGLCFGWNAKITLPPYRADRPRR